MRYPSAYIATSFPFGWGGGSMDIQTRKHSHIFAPRTEGLGDVIGAPLRLRRHRGQRSLLGLFRAGAGVPGMIRTTGLECVELHRSARPLCNHQPRDKTSMERQQTQKRHTCLRHLRGSADCASLFRDQPVCPGQLGPAWILLT